MPFRLEAVLPFDRIAIMLLVSESAEECMLKPRNSMLACNLQLLLRDTGFFPQKTVEEEKVLVFPFGCS